MNLEFFPEPLISMALKILTFEEKFLITSQTSFFFSILYFFPSNTIPVGLEAIHLKAINNQSTGFHTNPKQNAFHIFFLCRDTTADPNLLRINAVPMILCSYYVQNI